MQEGAAVVYHAFKFSVALDQRLYYFNLKALVAISFVYCALVLTAQFQKPSDRSYVYSAPLCTWRSDYYKLKILLQNFDLFLTLSYRALLRSRARFASLCRPSL